MTIRAYRISAVVALAFATVGPMGTAEGQTFTKVTTGPLVTTGSQSLSAAWADIDGDGNLDVYAANTQGSSHLFRNNGAGSFTSLVNSPLATAVGATTSGAWGDYDNDGNLDLFAANRWQNHFLYQGTGGTNFVAVTNSIVLAGGPETYHASWVDYDNDGLLDLFVVNAYALSDLYRNHGGGNFSKNTNAAIANGSTSWIGGAWADYNNDGRMDVFMSGFGGTPDSLYRNDGDGVFTSAASGDMGSDTGGAISSSWADYDNDGDLDLFVANRDGVNFLYRNDASGGFTKITTGDIVTDVADSNSAAWGDYDNDGWLDLYVANGDIPAMEANFLYHNNGNGTFTKITTGSPATDVEQSLCANWVDYDNDGDLDLHVTSNGNTSLYRNDGAAGNWLKVKLAGSLSNRAAIGAKVRVTATINGVQRSLLRFVSGDGGFQGQNLEQHFGLGDATIIEELRVEWPSGRVQTTTNLGINQRLSITESSESSVAHIIPAGHDDVDGNYYSGTLHEGQLRLQAVYAAGNFPAGSLTITELRFRRDINEPPFNSATAAATVKLSTTARSPGGLSAIFSENPGLDETTVFSGNWTYSSPTAVPPGTVRPFEIVLPLTTPFTYDPANGNLLFDIRVTSNSNLNWTDGVSGGQVSRVVAFNADAASGSPESTGDVIQLVLNNEDAIRFAPPGGVFTNSVQVAIQSITGTGTIRYTTDGNEPTLASTTYTEPFTLTETTTVKARLYVNGFPASEIEEATYTRYVPPDIAFDPPGQLFTNQLSVTLVNNVGAGSTIRYTLNGSAPTSTSTAYAGPISLTAAAAIRARVFFNSFAVSEEFQESYARVYAFGDDGVPFAWREQYFGPDFLTNPCAAAGADCDNDGYSVTEEYQYSTDPTDGGSAPEIILTVRAVPRLTFTTIPGRSYQIQRTTTLNPPDWQVIVESVTATGSELHYVDEEAPDNSYYQIELITE